MQSSRVQNSKLINETHRTHHQLMLSLSAHREFLNSRPKLTEELKAAELPRELEMSFRGADFSSSNSELVLLWRVKRCKVRSHLENQ